MKRFIALYILYSICISSHAYAISVDAVNINYNYSTDKNISTKIVNKPFNIQLIHRDTNHQKAPYQAWNGSKPMVVLLTLDNNGTVTLPLNNPSLTQFLQGVEAITVQGLILTKAHRDKRFKLAYIDWNTVLSRVASDSLCITDQNESKYLNGLPQCFEDYNATQDVFPLSTFPQMAECFGVGIPAGTTYACNPSAYDINGEVTANNIAPQIYSHNYGCYQCITEGDYNFTNYSTDNFAARPDYFYLNNTTNEAFPDLLRSGTEYGLSLTAYDGAITPSPTLDYNTSTDKLSMPNPLLDPDGLINVPLEGNTTLNTQVMNDEYSNIRNGILIDNNGNEAERIAFSFDNVAEVRAFVRDIDWASVDADDTPLTDCDDNRTPVNYNGIPIEAARGICGQVDTRFIPHHFGLSPTLRNYNTDGNFTYIASDLNMSAHVSLYIEVQNEQNQITTNFKEGAYQNPMAVDLNVTDWNTSFGLDANIIIKDIPNTLSIDFGTNGDNNGTHTIKSNGSTPAEQRLLFNYARTNNNPKNPFVINGSKAKLTVTSNYISDRNISADINGSNVADGNVTFIYVRAHPTKYLYEINSTNTVKTPIMIQTYCDQWPASAANCPGVDTNTPSRDRRWFMATTHQMNLGDGNVTLTSTTSNAVSPNIVSINAGDIGVDNTPTVTCTAASTVNITFNTTNTSDWLIYNKDADNVPDPFYNVRCLDISTSGWTGEGKTGHVVDDDINTKKTRRLGW